MAETHKHQDFAETNKLKNLSKADISKEIININENKKINKYSDVFKNAEKYLYQRIKVIDEALKSDWRDNDTWAYKKLSLLKDSIQRSKEKQEDAIWCQDSHIQRMINEVAVRIDDAENVFFEHLESIKNKRAEFEKQGILDKKGNVIIEKKLYDVWRFGEMKLTKDINPMKIHEAFQKLLNTDGTAYKIDYTNCTNKNIKDKMTTLIGGNECRVQFNKETGTYLIRDKEWKEYDTQRVLIWEWVEISSAKTASLSKKSADKKSQEIAEKKFKQRLGWSDQIDWARKEELQNMIPKKLRDKLLSDGMEEFLIKNEQRIAQIVLEARKYGYTLRWEPITTKRWWGLMEAHLINGSSEKDVTIRWKNNNDKEFSISSHLYDLLDDYSDEYKDFLTALIKDKRSNSEQFAKHEKIDFIDWEAISEQDQIAIEKGLSRLQRFLENKRDQENNSRASNDDKHIAEMLSLIWKARHIIGRNIETSDPKQKVTKAMFEKGIIEPFKEHFRNLVRVPSDLMNSNDSWNKFFYDEKSQISTIRNIDKRTSLTDFSASSFLKDEIVDDWEFWIENKNIDEAFKKIDTFFLDENNETLKNEIIDNPESGERIFKKLKEIWIIPESCDRSKNLNFFNAVIEKTNKIANALKEQKRHLDNMKPDMESQKRNLSTRKDQLIKIAEIRPLNNDEITELNSIKYLLEDEETLNQRATEALEVTKKTIRDTQTVQIIKHNLAEPFIEFGGGAKWNNKDIINNITWYGRARSDETAKIAGEITTQILITVAVSLATAGAGAAITAGLIARVGALWARLASSAIWAKRIKTFVSISQRWWKGFRTASKVEKAITIWTQASGLLLEGTIFNATSTALSNMINGREFLNGVTLNPLAKENIKTAAFLWALGIAKSFSIIWSRTTLPWKSATKIWIDFSKLGKIPWVKFTAEIAKELSAMFAAEQVINFTFGHDTINQETGEITTERGFHMPNEQEWATMIGMILALKVANPTLWGKIHQNLNNGTIKICKSIKWKTVLYNPKNNKIVDLNNLAKDWNKLVDNTTNRVKTKNKPTSDMGWKTIDIKNLSPEILDAIKHTEKQIASNNRRINELQQSKRQNPLSWKEKIELMQLYEANRDLKNDLQELKKGNMKLSEDSSSKLLEKYADIEKKMIALKEKADKRSNKLPEIQSEKTKKAASDWLNKLKIEYFELALEQDILIEQWIDWVNQFKILKDIIDMNQIAKDIVGDFKVKDFIGNNKGLTLEKLKELRNVLNGNKLDLYDLHQYSTIFEKHPDLDIAFTRKLIEKIEGKPLMDKYEKYIDFLYRYPNINHKMIKEIFEFTKEEPTFDKVEKCGELLKNHPEMDSNMLLEELKKYKREEQPKSSEDKTGENMGENSDNSKDSNDVKTSEKEVQENNKQMDDILKWSAEKSIETKLKEIKDFIEKKLSKKFNKTIQLSEQAVKTLVGIRNLIKKFWKLTYKQLKTHIKTLSDMIKDNKIVRFLLEWWFCGRVKRNETKKEDLNNKEQRTTEKEKILKEDDIIFEKQEVKVEKSDKKISFEKNNIEGFKEMFEKYRLNGEKIPVGNFEGMEIVKSDLMKILQENWYVAKHQIKIGKETVYLSDVFNKWKDYLVGYTADWEIRLFYKSESEGLRRSCDWIRSDWALSKWERIENYSYETTTQVEHSIGEFFDSLPQRKSWIDSQDPFTVIANKYGHIPNILRPSLQTGVQVEKIGKFEHNNAVKYYQYKSVNAVQEFYRNLKTDITLSWISETYSFQHPGLWEIHVDIVKAKLKDGTDIKLHFWHAVNDNPNSVFIIRWDYLEWDVNSFGIKSKQLNLWPLWAKPIDYTSQVPIDWMSNNFKRYGEDYVDIRALYQEMPLIKSYKEMIKKAENKSETKSKNNT